MREGSQSRELQLEFLEKVSLLSFEKLMEIYLNAAPTNYHAICPPNGARRDTKKKANRFGSQFDMPNDTNTYVHFFALKDIEMTSAELQHLSEMAQKSLYEATSGKEIRKFSCAWVPRKY